MNLRQATPVAFLYVGDRERALGFYRDTLGLALRSSDDFGDFIDLGGGLLRMTVMADHKAHPHPVLGWNVEDIEAAAADAARARHRLHHLRRHGPGRARHLDRAGRRQGRLLRRPRRQRADSLAGLAKRPSAAEDCEAIVRSAKRARRPAGGSAEAEPVRRHGIPPVTALAAAPRLSAALGAPRARGRPGG